MTIVVARFWMSGKFFYSPISEDCIIRDGILRGRQAIEKRYADTFQRSPSTIFSNPRDYLLRAIDNAVWSAGEWWSTLQGETGIVFVRGYWSAICVREGDPWKIRLLTLSEHPGGYPVSNGHTEQPIAS
jgi:hypothetical protein